MGYTVVEIDPVFLGTFEKVTPSFDHHAHHQKLKNPHVEKVWIDRIGPHKSLYCVHIKTGGLGNHHHFTVTYEAHFNHHHHLDHVQLLDIHEGHKTFW